MKILPGGMLGVIVAWSPTILWGYYIHTLLCTPAKEVKMPFLMSWLYNTGHGFLFGILCFLLLFALTFTGLKGKRLFWTAFAVSTLWSAIEEILQANVPGRSPGFLDVSTSALGSVLVLFLVLDLVAKGRPRSRSLFLFIGMAASGFAATIY